MAGFRPVRMAEIIHREVAARLLRDVKDPRVTPISITRVEVAGDLSRASIEFLPLGGGPVTAELREGLSTVARQLRGPVGRALGVRHAPELVFTPDRHTEAAIRVSSLLEQLGRPSSAGDAPADEADEATDASDATDSESSEEG